MLPIQKITPEQAAVLEEEYLNPQAAPAPAPEVAPAPVAPPPAPVVGAQVAAGIDPLNPNPATVGSGVMAGIDPMKPKTVDQIRFEKYYRTQGKNAFRAQPQTTPAPTPAQEAETAATDAREERENRLQAMFDARKKELEKARTDDVKMAAFNSLGNALRALVQPIGWGVGGATAGVQQADNRQYIDAFNRAVRAGEDLRNLGLQEDQLRLNYADRDYQQAQQEATYQRRRNESQEDYFARLDQQAKIEGAKTYQVLLEKRREKAVEAFYTERARRISHREPLISFREFIDLEGLGRDYYGDWIPSEEQVKTIEENAPKKSDKAAETGGKVTDNGKQPVTPPANDTGKKTDGAKGKKAAKVPVGQTAISANANEIADKWKGYGRAGGLLTRRAQARMAAEAPVASTPAATAQDNLAKKWGGKQR